MIRCSDLALALLLSTPVGAGPLVADAFGLYDPATSGDRAAWSGVTSTGTIAPRGPDHIAIFAGPKSLVAGHDRGHVVAIVLDRAGNLVADGTPATLTIAGTRQAVRTRHGIAEVLILPRTHAGDLFAGATSGDRQSPRAMLTVVADVGSIRPQVASPLPAPQSETIFEIASTPLADRFGNPAPDGTAASLLLAHADGSYSLSFAQTLGGSLRAQLIARDIPGPAKATLTLGAYNSPAALLTITAPAPSGRPALSLEPLPTIAAQRLTLGPFLTTDGYAISDGAKVTLTAVLADGSGFTDSAFTQDGSISLLLPIADPTAVTSLQVQSPLGLLDLTEDWRTASATGPAP